MVVPRHIHTVGLVGLLLVLAAPVSADKSVGVAAGVGLPLAPAVKPGVAAGLSTVLTTFESGALPAALLHLRGEVQGLWSPDEEVGAAMPLLSGDLGLEAGPLQLFLTGGVQIFGAAWRGGYTFFTVFGLVGGGGMTLRLHPAVAVELRCTVTWVPSVLAARIKEPDPEPEARPTLLFLSGLAGVVIPL